MTYFCFAYGVCFGEFREIWFTQDSPRQMDRTQLKRCFWTPPELMFPLGNQSKSHDIDIMRISITVEMTAVADVEHNPCFHILVDVHDC